MPADAERLERQKRAAKAAMLLGGKGSVITGNSTMLTSAVGAPQAGKSVLGGL